MKAKKTAIIVLSALFVTAVLFSQVFVTVEANHDCVGEDCPVCHSLEAVGSISKSVKPAEKATFIARADDLIRFSDSRDIAAVRLATLTELKIKLLN
ncbi:MAG: hypothetical protein J5762_02655 [Clostridia bacterium]|nr:hypothetical protein [Clostridia bacterium]